MQIYTEQFTLNVVYLFTYLVIYYLLTVIQQPILPAPWWQMHL